MATQNVHNAFPFSIGIDENADIENMQARRRFHLVLIQNALETEDSQKLWNIQFASR